MLGESCSVSLNLYSTHKSFLGKMAYVTISLKIFHSQRSQFTPKWSEVSQNHRKNSPSPSPKAQRPLYLLLVLIICYLLLLELAGQTCRSVNEVYQFKGLIYRILQNITLWGYCAKNMKQPIEVQIVAFRLGNDWTSRPVFTNGKRHYLGGLITCCISI